MTFDPVRDEIVVPAVSKLEALALLADFLVRTDRGSCWQYSRVEMGRGRESRWVFRRVGFEMREDWLEATKRAEALPAFFLDDTDDTEELEVARPPELHDEARGPELLPLAKLSPAARAAWELRKKEIQDAWDEVLARARPARGAKTVWRPWVKVAASAIAVAAMFAAGVGAAAVHYDLVCALLGR